MLSSLSLLALSTARCPSIVNGTSFGKSETASSIEKKQCSSASLCCARCSAETACAAWSFYVGPNETQLCNLLRGVGWSTRTDVPGASSGVSTPPSPPSPPGGAKNLLYLMVDDLRTLTPAARLWTPNLNKLAASGVTFSHAYCQHAVCAPSRNSFMSGLRPETTQVWTFAGNFRDCSDDVAGKTWIPHPEHYKRSGFLTLGGGKTYHPKHPPNYDEPFSWSPERPYFPFSEKGCPFFQTSAENAYTHSLCVLDIDREDTFDHRLANDTIHSLRFAAAANANASAAAEGAPAAAAKPFAIFAGFRRPHVPWRLPRYWWDRFANLTVSPPKNSSVYADAPQIAFTCGDRCDWLLWDPDAANTSAGQGRANVRNTSYSRTVALPDAYASTIRRGYFAAMALMDDAVGQVLDELDRLGLRDSTLVIFHADHGWGLGEANLWHKFTNYEASVRVPLIVRAPWLLRRGPNPPAGAPGGLLAPGSTVSTPIELVDIYPTAASLTLSGAVANASHLDGVDFSPLLRGGGNSSVVATLRCGGGAASPLSTRRLFTFSDFPRCNDVAKGTRIPANGSDAFAWPTTAFESDYCKSAHARDIWAMGYSVRSLELRYTRWMRWDGDALAVGLDGWSDGPKSAPTSLLGEELYDHTGDDGTDFDAFPLGHANLINAAAAGGQWAAELATLRLVLAKFFRDKDKCIAFSPESKAQR